MKFTPYIAACIIAFVAAAPVPDADSTLDALVAREAFPAEFPEMAMSALQTRSEEVGALYARDASAEPKKNHHKHNKDMVGYVINCKDESGICKILNERIDELKKKDKKQKSLRKIRNLKKKNRGGLGGWLRNLRENGKGKGKKDRKQREKDDRRKKDDDERKKKEDDERRKKDDADKKNREDAEKKLKDEADKKKNGKRDQMYADLVARSIYDGLAERDVDFPALVARDAEPEAAYEELYARDAAYDELSARDAAYEELSARDAAYEDLLSARDAAYEELSARDAAYEELSTRDAEPEAEAAYEDMLVGRDAEAADNGLWWPGKYEPVGAGGAPAPASAAPAPAPGAAPAAPAEAAVEARDAFEEGLYAGQLAARAVDAIETAFGKRDAEPEAGEFDF